MATTITTVTKKASVVKTTKGSEKKWSEILTMNRRHDLQLPLDIAKYNQEFKRTYNLCQRQQNQTERLWTHKHETWYHDDFVFRNRLLKQLKPITRRFKHIDSLSAYGNEDQQQDRVLHEQEMASIEEEKIPVKRELPPLAQYPRRQVFIQKVDTEEVQQPKIVFSKLVCPKLLQEGEPRLYSHHHGPFLDIAQRFLQRKPELIEKGMDYNGKQNQQKQYLKSLIENEQERTRLAMTKFGKQLDEEKNKNNHYDDSDNEDDDYYS